MTLTAQEALRKIAARLQTYPSHHIPSPTSQPRRACVALILRWHTKQHDLISQAVAHSTPKTVQEFFDLPWVKHDPDGQPELLFMQRATHAGDRWSGHVAYIGGKNEPGETDLETVTREVMEEIGLDLTSDAFIQLGRLDDREVTSTYDKKLMMILIPFVFLQVVPDTPTMQLQKNEVASVEWIPLDFFLSPTTDHSTSFAEESLTPRVAYGWRRSLMQILLGTITFPAVDLPVHDLILGGNDNSSGNLSSPPRRFKLWGLTLGMTRDLIQMTGQDDLAFLTLVSGTPGYSRKDIGWWVKCISKIRYYWRWKITQSLIASPSKSRQRAEWDKIYYESLRTGIVAAVTTRVLLMTVGISWIIRYRHRLLSL